MFWTDGSYYKGNWKDGVQHGQGELKLADGQVKKGFFTNNKFCCASNFNDMKEHNSHNHEKPKSEEKLALALSLQPLSKTFHKDSCVQVGDSDLGVEFTKASIGIQTRPYIKGCRTVIESSDEDDSPNLSPSRQIVAKSQRRSLRLSLQT